MYHILSLLQLFLFLNISNSSRILIVNPIPSYSHQVVFHGIVKALSESGHEIVFITTHPMNDATLKHVREIDMSFSNQIWIQAVRTLKPDIFNKVFALLETMANIVEAQLARPEIQALIKNKTEHFDAVLLSYLSPGIFAYKFRFNCPFIGALSLEATNDVYESLGNGINSALYPDTLLYRPIGNIFMRRLYNFCMNAIGALHRKYVIDPKATKSIRKYFGKNYPDSETLSRETDLLFVSSNLAFNDPRPVIGSIIFIGGGLHIKKPKELPKELKLFLDNSKRGVIYMCFGSNVQSAQLPDKIKKIFFKAFSDLPFDILWKFESNTTLAIPKNVFMLKWMPQQDLLRHKNIKLFITHGGQQSTEEGILNGVPMLSIPFYADQLYNSHKIDLKKIGIMIDDLNAITAQQLKSLIFEIIENPRYKNNVERLSAILVDEPMTPQEKVVWWTEYVIRNKGAKHLRAPTLCMHKLYLFDIFGMMFLVLLILIFLLFKILKCSYQLFTVRVFGKKIKVS